MWIRWVVNMRALLPDCVLCLFGAMIHAAVVEFPCAWLENAQPIGSAPSMDVFADCAPFCFLLFLTLLSSGLFSAQSPSRWLFLSSTS